MSFDAWIYAKPSSWSAIARGEGDPELFWYTAYQDAKVGFLLDYPGGFRVYHTVGSEEQITAIVAALKDHDPTSVAHKFCWDQGPGTDSLYVFPTDPAIVLAVMPPHVVYDDDGEIVSSIPATLNNPNWGIVTAGQSVKDKIVAGGFSNGFSDGFR